MATGLVGTSTADNTSTNTTVTGSTLSYTCPASGVRYAVVTISEMISYTVTTTGNACTATAGTLVAPFGVIVIHASPVRTTYSVILGPGSNWSGNTSVALGNTGAMAGYARLIVSVLEVI